MRSRLRPKLWPPRLSARWRCSTPCRRFAFRLLRRCRNNPTRREEIPQELHSQRTYTYSCTKGGTLKMGTFNSSKTFPYFVDDIAPVAQDVMDHFKEQDFEVTETNISTGGVQVSIRKGGTFKAIIGMKTALNIKIEPVANGTTVDAGVGIFGQQAVPTAITLLVFWPVIIAQVWNMAKEADLDDEALDVAEESLKAHGSKATSEAAAEYPN